FSFLFDTQIYLRERKVRHLNRKRSKDKRLHYRSKYNLAREMLMELEGLLPEDCQVYVLFDSWYASAKLINFCLRHTHWHVVCALKSNRKIEKVRVDVHNQTLGHKPYQKITLAAVDKQHPVRTYYIRTVAGQIEDVPQEVYVIISTPALASGAREKRPGDLIAPSTSCAQTLPCRLRKP
ncbi:MAG: transposase, partial [Anaerolineales bacterium]|nr:transposase [Anaerolineales bacterium]